MTDIRKVHARVIRGAPARIAELVRDLDAIWPVEIAPAPSPLGERLYAAPPMTWEEIERPGAVRAFRVVEPGDLRAEHWFEVDPVGRGTLVRHVVEGTARGAFEAVWSTRVEPLHDRILEALLDNLERAVAPDPDPRVSAGPAGAIRPIAAAVIRSGDRILVWDDLNPATGEVVAVPLAGGIEFGETGEAAIRRELLEEIGAAAAGVRYLGAIEDIFDWNGQTRHELHLVYEVEPADRRILELDEVEVDDEGERYVARWRPLREFRDGARLVPDGLLALIDGDA